MHIKKTLTLLFVVIVCLNSCKKDEKIDCTGVTPTYSNEISKIFNESCAFAGCHLGPNAEADLDLSNFENVKLAATKGSVIKSIKHASGVSAMPKGGNKLTDATIKMVECWVQNGTPE